MKHMIIVLCAIALLGGCGGSRSSDSRAPVEPSLDYAMFVRGAAARLKRAEAGHKVAVDMFLENMDGYEKKPLGKHKATYDGIYKNAQDLKQMVARKSTDAEVKKQIDELLKLTEQLPSAPAGQK
jgi:hypothetical protein